MAKKAGSIVVLIALLGAFIGGTAHAAQPATTTISLVQGWNLIAWPGPTMEVSKGLAGGPKGTASGTNDVTTDVSVLWGYDSSTQTWQGYFPTAANVPGANDLTELLYAHGYFVYATSAVQWAAATGSVGSSPSTTPTPAAGSTGGIGTVGASSTGNDISYPQCGGNFPNGQAFGIVGVNDGIASTLNPCFGPSTGYPSYAQSELYWAVATSSGASAQPKASLYVNTGDPGNLYNSAPVPDWPSTGSTPYGSCSTTTVTTSPGTYTVGANSNACAWEYGFQRATQDIAWLTDAANAINAQAPSTGVPSAAKAYAWWLDVETVNSWQTGATGQAMNVAALQGMVAALQGAGAAGVGVYSTSPAWMQVTGGTSSASGSLNGLPDWMPGASDVSQAEANCGLASFSGGSVKLTEWLGNSFDGDYACPVATLDAAASSTPVP